MADVGSGDASANARVVVGRFADALRTLTDNDGTKITELSKIAVEYKDLASSIVAVTEKHIAKCLPKCKLWGLYVADCIIKK